jgi:ribosomal protein L11 methylase PrmA
VDLASDALWRAGATAIEERETATGVLLVAGVAPRTGIGPLLAAVQDRWPAEVTTVDVDGALDAWRAFARPVTVGRRLRVRPPWLAAGPRAAAVEVLIDPGRAFGSGAHASTRLALAAIERLVRGGERVLDAGCGSGVLGVAALALGASQAVGVDRDPDAVVASRANAARNGLADRFTVTGRSLGEVAAAGPPFDLVAANLLLPDLLAGAPALRVAIEAERIGTQVGTEQYGICTVSPGRTARPPGNADHRWPRRRAHQRRHLAAGGSLVVSGILVDQRPPVMEAAARLGLVAVGEETAEGWLALTFTRRPG